MTRRRCAPWWKRSCACSKVGEHVIYSGSQDADLRGRMGRMLCAGTAVQRDEDVLDDEPERAGDPSARAVRACQYGQAHMEAAQGALPGGAAAVGIAQGAPEEEQHLCDPGP